MNAMTHEEKVKDVGGNDDVLCIELFNGLRLMGPMRTASTPREQPAPKAESAQTAFASPVAAS